MVWAYIFEVTYLTLINMGKKPRWSASEVVEFCGWDFLQRMLDLARLTRTRRLIAAGFLTGGRIAETLVLEDPHFDFDMDPNMVVVRAMPVVKRHEKVGEKRKWKCTGHCKMRWGTRQRPREPRPDEFERHTISEYMGWETKLKKAYRTFPFPKAEPLVPVLRDLLQGIDGPLFGFKYDTAYNELIAIGKELGTWIPTHWFRAQRASQLALEYGFEEHDLVEWFLWRDYMTAIHYARKGYKGLAAKMVRIPPPPVPSATRPAVS